MDSTFDKATEGARERDLMARVRGGAIRPDDVPREGLPFFVKIQIQTTSPCNAACVMCPWPSTADALPQGTMDEGVYRRIVDEIAGRGVERTSLFLMNEPTLDRRLPRRTAYLKAKEPRTAAVIFTNGVLLDRTAARALADAGMDEIAVSMIGFDRDTYERNMKGCDFDAVLANLSAISEDLRAGRLGSLRLRVVGLDMPGVAAGARDFERRIGIAPELAAATTRAGLVDLDGLGVRNAAAPSMRACQRPFVKAYVLWNGDLVLCNCDWTRSTVFGNVRDSSLESLWNGAYLGSIRRAHAARDLSGAPLCAKCDYPYLP